MVGAPSPARTGAPAPLEGALLPDYGGACVVGVIEALFARETGDAPAWLPSPLAEAGQVALLVVDGLGALQLAERRRALPLLGAMAEARLTTVAPSTTAAALTSLASGLTPAEHGILGYRLDERGSVLNVLRWQVAHKDARAALAPEIYQPHLPFGGRRVPVVSRAEFAGSGFTEAHLRGAPLVGWRVASSIAVEVGRLLRGGSPLVYAYYDGLDSVAHTHGLDEHYEAELAFVDHLATTLLAALPAGAALAICADHGILDIANPPLDLADFGVRPRRLSGEGRFRWLHLRRGEVEEVVATLRPALGGRAWVATREELVATGVFGGPLPLAFERRLGDVAVIAREDVSFLDRADPGDAALVGRHGSLTPGEMLVPLLGCRP